jgi:hypothetical protein
MSLGEQTLVPEGGRYVEYEVSLFQRRFPFALSKTDDWLGMK